MSFNCFGVEVTSITNLIKEVTTQANEAAEVEDKFTILESRRDPF